MLKSKYFILLFCDICIHFNIYVATKSPRVQTVPVVSFESRRKRCKNGTGFLRDLKDLRLHKLINKPTFKYCMKYNKNFAEISLENSIINFCKPKYIGFSVLEVSKTLMYDSDKSYLIL